MFSTHFPRTKVRCLSVLLLCLATGGATAQNSEKIAQRNTPSAPDSAIPNWATIESVEVKAKPGPAVWHVTRGDSEVWILGLVGAMPKNLDWNKQYLSELLDGAHTIILPPQMHAGLLEVGWFLITHAGDLDMSLPRGQTLQAMIPAPVWSHFLAVLAAIGDKPEHYKTDNPIRAAGRLNNAFSTHANLAGDEPMATINKLAREKKVTVQPVFRVEVMPIAKEAFKVSVEDQRPCFGEAVEDVDRMSQHAVAAAEAWAVGDVKAVKANFAESRLSLCEDGLVHSLDDVDKSRVAGFVTAINDALNKPGKTIVVMGMGPLLRRGGVLEQLQAQHAAIEGPKE